MSTQSHDLHRSLLRPLIISTLRASGFAGTKPSVLDTLVSITERYILLLASTTAAHAINSHNDPIPTLTDVRMAMQDCGVLVPVEGGGEEEWRETMRRGVAEYEDMDGGEERARLVGKGREERDLKALRAFLRWFDSKEYAEIKRVAGMGPSADAAAAAVGVGGAGTVREEDFLEKLKKRYSRAGASEDARLVGTVLGRHQGGEGRGVVIEGGPVMHLREWRPRNGVVEGVRDAAEGDDVSMSTEGTMEGTLE